MGQDDARRAVVLLSGGLDSYTAASVARRDGYRIWALTVSYGQRHARELEAAKAVAAALGVERHVELGLDLSRFGGSSLTAEIEVPKDRPLAAGGIPNTYVPARNTVLLAVALAWAEVLDASVLVIGVNARDYSGYPDCRPEFIQAFERLAKVATRTGVEGGSFRVWAPLIDLTKAEIIRLGLSLGVNYALTCSCYDPRPDGAPCRRCDSCRLRAEGFRAAGVDDPLLARFVSHSG
ncbi:MAG: 7-cyano-7-deazaguanine synthase QueC [Acidobacteriota bacterium]